jgi:signal transduction histidine kinase/phage shock protein PspC (stress-responsive transcriptional regulator)
MQTTSAARPAHDMRIARSSSNRVVTGLAGGIGERLGVEPTLVRAAFLVLAMAGGWGLVLYWGLWLWSLSTDSGEPATTPALNSTRQIAAVASITLGILILVRETGPWPGDGLVWPVAFVAFGVSVIWVQGDGGRLGRGIRGSALDVNILSGASLLRIGAGALLILAGMGTLLAANMTFTLQTVLNLVLPVTVAIGGLTLIFGPWVFRLAQQVSDERRERVRTEERAEMAAHLHDSVLQTLALIQRSESSREVAMLARVQERELRAWLFGRRQALDAVSIDGAIDLAAARVEQAHQVSVETVVVGDAPLDEKLGALVGAASEAMVNAARHSCDEAIDVYVEVEPGVVVAYIRDHGRGFDMKEVPEDRRGITDSIVGRMQRYGGTARIESTRGEGTEVHLKMPR